jgi:hypothetical protein
MPTSILTDSSAVANGSAAVNYGSRGSGPAPVQYIWTGIGTGITNEYHLNTLIYEPQTTFSVAVNDTGISTARPHPIAAGANTGTMQEVHQYDFGAEPELPNAIGSTQSVHGENVVVLPKHRSRIKVSCPEGYLLVQFKNWNQKKQNCLDNAFRLQPATDYELDSFVHTIHTDSKSVFDASTEDYVGGYGGSSHDHIMHENCYELVQSDFAYVDLDTDFPSFDPQFAGSDKGAENLLDMESISTYRTCLEVEEGLGSYSQAYSYTSEEDFKTWPKRTKFTDGRNYILPAGETGPLACKAQARDVQSYEIIPTPDPANEMSVKFRFGSNGNAYTGQWDCTWKNWRVEYTVIDSIYTREYCVPGQPQCGNKALIYGLPDYIVLFSNWTRDPLMQPDGCLNFSSRYDLL